MRPTLVAVLLAVTVTPLLTTPAATAEPDMDTVRCTAIRDSAQCTARPDCWFDAKGGKGCLAGERPAEDRCVVHTSQSICDTSTLGCTWNAADETCVSKSN